MRGANRVHGSMLGLLQKHKSYVNVQDPSNTIIWHDMSFPSLFFVVQYAGLLKPPIGHREDRVRATPSALLRPTSKTVPLRRLHALTNTVAFLQIAPRSSSAQCRIPLHTASYVQEWSRALFQFTVQCNAHASSLSFFLFLPFSDDIAHRAWTKHKGIFFTLVQAI